MITPTIGRVVLVFFAQAQPQACPGLITYIYEDNTINVGGFTNAGGHFAECCIPLLQDDDKPPAEGAWAEWMPYQKEQAEKHALTNEAKEAASEENTKL